MTIGIQSRGASLTDIQDVEQNLRLADLEKRIGAIEAQAANLSKLLQLALSIAGAALGVDLIGMVP